MATLPHGPIIWDGALYRLMQAKKKLAAKQQAGEITNEEAAAKWEKLNKRGERIWLMLRAATRSLGIRPNVMDNVLAQLKQKGSHHEEVQPDDIGYYGKGSLAEVEQLYKNELAVALDGFVTVKTSWAAGSHYLKIALTSTPPRELDDNANPIVLDVQNPVIPEPNEPQESQALQAIDAVIRIGLESHAEEPPEDELPGKDVGGPPTKPDQI